ncbi:hypothetical protein LSAT2_014475 [Lamellibrachia satsuma]|nr:hypothetical protein LSAT2_014475 [Lamellibrachia satsuma]
MTKLGNYWKRLVALLEIQAPQQVRREPRVSRARTCPTATPDRLNCVNCSSQIREAVHRGGLGGLEVTSILLSGISDDQSDNWK